MVIREISESWRVREIPSAIIGNHNSVDWIPAQVPGHVHLDLMAAGIIPDPFHGLNERNVSWVDDSDWVYETTFHVSELVTKNAYLVFQGLDTLAEIELNGEPLGQTDNMFIAHEFPVGDRLKVGAGELGDNTLSVTFRSARRVGMERQAEWDAAGNDTLPANWDFWNSRSFVRKAQYMFGWDWGPVLISCGLWKPVELVQIPAARILDWKYDVEFTGGDSAAVQIEVFVERAPAALDSDLVLSVSSSDKSFDPVSVPVAKTAGRTGVSLALSIEEAKRWEVNGIGEAHLYPIELKLESETVADAKNGTIGLRTIELVCEPDADGQGESFKFRVNGSDVFIKGANWIPTYSFPSREKIGQQIRQARDAGFNMMRIWGGGLYESEEFYRQCDEYGLMVWQDFPYACAYYPDTGAYLEAAKREATAAVRRLRTHPSLAMWCGNNENDTMFHTGWGGIRPKRLIGEHLYQQMLPSVLAEEDSGRAYRPSSPYGGDDPNSPDFGDQHNWDVWHGRGDWMHYAENRSRFVSEFGFAASCGISEWNGCLAEADKGVHSMAVRWHDKTRKGYDTYLGYVTKHFPEPRSLHELVHFTQANQAEALKFGIEHYRRLKGRCWGTLFWQLNDCWPVQSWSIIDSNGEPKAAYYAGKKFYAPVLLSLTRTESIVEAILVNDLLTGIEGEVALSLERFDGTVLAQEAFPVSVPANGVGFAGGMSIAAASGCETESYLYAVFTPSPATPARQDSMETLLLLREPKDLLLQPQEIALTVEDAGDRFTVRVESPQFAAYAWLHRRDEQPFEISDNFFHLRPKQVHTLSVPKRDTIQSARELEAELVVRTLLPHRS